MITLVRGSIVIQDAGRWLENAAVAYDGEMIVTVGPFDELRERWPQAHVIGGPDCWVLPGLANAHDHGRGAGTFDWGLADGPLETWRLEQQGRPQPNAYWQALYYGLLMLRTGVTTLVHHHSTGVAPGGLLEQAGDALRAYRELGLRVCFGIGVWDQNRLVYGSEDEFIGGLPLALAGTVRERWGLPVGLDETLSVARELTGEAAGSRISVYLAPQGPQWCSEALLKAVKRAADEIGTGLHTHLLETVYQKMWAERVLARSVVEALDEWGFLDDRLTCAHAVWLSDSDMELLAERGVCIAHNPSSNLRLRSGLARVPAMLARGTRVGIGLDGMGFPEQDIFAEMRLALALGRPPGLETPTLDERTVWRMTTEGGTRAALGRDDLGVLEAGRPADLVVMNGAALAEPFSAVAHEPVERAIWRGRPELVETVVVGGELLVENGEPLKANPKGVAQQINSELSAIEARHEREPWRDELAEHVRRFYASWGGPPVQEWSSERHRQQVTPFPSREGGGG
jgi:5-methylthioadenosine/S-adenosylhomocysteine deaminase